MARTRYVVTYDIADDRRRNHVFRTLHGFGDHTQYSVFLCELNDSELVRLRMAVRPHIDTGEDQLLIVEVGPATGSVTASVEAIGRHYDPPTRSVVI
jgi:CRISPR-associated protein Cas2